MTIPLSGEEFTGVWEVEADDSYFISDGRLRILGTSRPRLYKPQQHPELPFEIAKLADASDNQIIRFATQWGMLGYYELAEAKRVQVHAALRQDVSLEQVQGEPVDWIRSHGRSFWLCVRLADRLAREDHESLRTCLRQFFEMEEAADEQGTRMLAWENGLRFYFFIGEKESEPQPIERAIATRTLDLARLMIESEVNRGMEGIEPRMAIDVDPAITFKFDAMIQIAYLHVARLTVEKGQVDYCQECGRPFRKTDARQRFCPRGQFESESRCGYKHRYKQWMSANPHRRRKGGQE